MAQNRTTSTIAEVVVQPSSKARTTSTTADILLNTGPANARTTSTTADILVNTGPAKARVTSTVLEALRTVTSIASGGWVSVPTP